MLIINRPNKGCFVLGLTKAFLFSKNIPIIRRAQFIWVIQFCHIIDKLLTEFVLSTRLTYPTFLFSVKYRAALNRALDMIRTFVKACLDSATNSASAPTATASVSASAPHSAFTLFYGKFRAAAPR